MWVGGGDNVQMFFYHELYQCDGCYIDVRRVKLGLQWLWLNLKMKYYEATWQGNVKKNIESVHEKVKYPCHQCEYKATRSMWQTMYTKRRCEETRDILNDWISPW